MTCLFTRSLIRRRLLNQLSMFRSSLFFPCCPVVKPLMFSDFMERKSPSISRFFSSRSLDLDDKQGPAVIDYSGPFRFDWDQSSQTWVYRRTKASLLPLLETDLESLCGEPIKLSRSH